MFFKKKNKLSISREDKALIDETFSFAKTLFGEDIFLKKEVILPTQKFFPIDFRYREEDVLQIFNKIALIMDVDTSKIKIAFYSERKNMEFLSGLVPILDENEVLTTGRYVEYDNGDIEILVEEQELYDFMSLVATLSHELAHFKLRNDVSFKEEDEVLTDILTIAFGFGIFTANSSVVKMNSWTDGNVSGWQVKGGSGYLHYKVCGYALALYAYLRSEKSPVWTKYLEKDVHKEYSKNFKYLIEGNE